MSTSTDRLTRLLALLPWLQARPGVPVAEAARVFGVTEEVLRRDLELLFCCGLPGGSPGDLIDISFEGDTITVLDAQTLDRPLRLTADEALALVVAARALADVPGLPEHAALDRARQKIEQAAGAAAPDPGEVQVTLDAAPDVLGTLRAALDSGHQLALSYLVESRDEVTDRLVDPLRILLTQGRSYLEGYCHRAEAVRLFRVDRVLRAEVLDVAAQPPPEAVPRDLAEGLFQPRPEDARVELDLDSAARWVRDYYPTEEEVELPGNRLRLVLRTPDTRWVVALVLRLGGHARIVSPAELARAVPEAARRALASYQSD
ncbi:MAG: helix-turn-helix transcriptional regulator [Mycobacteriales bacterium]